MKVLIVLVIALACAGIGGFVGGSMTDTGPADPPPSPAGKTLTAEESLRESMKAYGAGAEVARQRNRNMTIGGVVGLVVGIGAGALVASKMGTRPAVRA